MGRTWPNLDAERVPMRGYYWNERLKKLARLQPGEKLPRNRGWVFFAGEHEGSSSEIARRLFDAYPEMQVNDFTYTTRTPLDRRLPIGDHPGERRRWTAFLAGMGAGAIALGLFLSASSRRRRFEWRR